MLLPKQVGSLPPSLSTEYPSLRKLSFLGGGRQFLASDSWLEAPENSPKSIYRKRLGGQFSKWPSGPKSVFLAAKSHAVV